MIAIGLTGGIGSGKSTVASMLAARGAVVIDADELAREVVEVDRPGHSAVVGRFGEKVLAANGSLDRGALAALVFNDPVALADLEAIVHPKVRAAIVARLAGEATSDHVVVVDVPLLVERGEPESFGFAGVLVVDAPLDMALERLVSRRGMDRADAQARIATQASRDERIARADFVIMNMGTLDELSEMVRRAWEWMERLRAESRRDAE
jgi:dephospho-CoA kinase